MSSAMQKGPGGVPQRSDDQLQHDRRIAVAVMFFILALMAILAWLASMNGTPVPVDSWPTML